MKSTVKAMLEQSPLQTVVPVVALCPGYHGHSIARSLGRPGVPLYGIFADAHSPGGQSRYWRQKFIWDSAKAHEEQSVEWLLALGSKIGGRPLLVPTDDDSCVFVADHATELQEAFLFPQQPPGLVRSLSSKKEMYYLCKQHGIPTAETSFPESRNDVIEFGKHAQFPVLLKGIDTVALKRRTGVKMVKVHDAQTLLKLYDEMETPESPNIMLQEFLSGGSQTSWMFDGYFNEESECLFGLTAHMVRQYPAYAGVASLAECVANETVAMQTKRFMKAIGYRGALDIGYKYDNRTGQYKAFDANPRIGVTFRLLVDSVGMDVAQAFYRDMTGQPVITGEGREGRKWLVEYFDIVSSPTYMRQEHMSIGQWLHSYRGVEEVSWFAWDDPAPFLMMGWRSFQRGVGRLLKKSSDTRADSHVSRTVQPVESVQPVL